MKLRQTKYYSPNYNTRRRLKKTAMSIGSTQAVHPLVETPDSVDRAERNEHEQWPYWLNAEARVARPGLQLWSRSRFLNISQAFYRLC